jgi:CheY-like chemotaxis protein
MNSSQKNSLSLYPTKLRPLLGLTLLLVEDSRFTCEVVRMMCQRSGARLRRADCLKSAERHLGVYRPGVVIIDIGLPDGSGLSLIRKLHHESPRIPMILGTSGDELMHHSVLKAGADGFLTKPIESLAGFQSALLSKLPTNQQVSGPRAVTDDIIIPDPIAYCDDLRHASKLLKRMPIQSQDYIFSFLDGVCRSKGDMEIIAALKDRNINNLRSKISDRITELIHN